MKLLDRDAEYIQTLMIPPRELPVRIWYMYKDTPCTLIDVDEMQKIVHIRNYVDNIQFRAFGIKALRIIMNFWNQDASLEREIR